MKVIIVILVLNILESDAKIFTRCRLTKELNNMRSIQKMFLGNWVCLIEQVSGRDTSKEVTSSSGKKSYGLYQIPSKWCKAGRKGGDCNIACESLLDDDIRDDTECAVNIFNKEGFKYWNIWSIRCKNKVDHITTEIYKCPGLTSRMSPERDIPDESPKNHRRHIGNGVLRWFRSHHNGTRTITV